ncbi:DUF6493 family protein [Streptomyces litmocidini]|uniref:DUF6493 family protein n=1 Tax=Streptomyces litmocidini TaxID=67318 RepID=A0ABW7UAS4_9ACTN
MTRSVQTLTRLRPSVPEPAGPEPTGSGGLRGGTGGAKGEGGAEELLAAVREGRAAAVPGLLESLDASARKAALTRLRALRAEVGAGKRATPPHLPDRVRSALYVAGAGCLPASATTAVAASWLGARDLLVREEDGALALAALGDRAPEWAADPALVATRRAQGPDQDSCLHQALSGVLDARLWEAADLVGTDALPFLLATPTWSTGAIEPRVLVERLREYRDAGVEPAPTDLAQALVRVARADPSAGRAAEEAAALGTPAGRRLAARLRGEGIVGATVRFLPRDEDGAPQRWWPSDRLVVDLGEHPAVRAEFPPAFRWLGGAPEAAPRRCPHRVEGRAEWATVLPADRELLAACLLPTLAHRVEGDARGAAEPLTALVEADGPVGRAVLLALAFGLGRVDADDRLRAVDGVLVLAARGELNARRLGAELAWLVAEGSVKPNRLADAARTAAATGAYRTVWTVLEAMLPEVLAPARPVRGLGEVLAVAADCVERCGARGEVAGLDALASGRGSSQLVVQAGRLLSALRQGADQPPTETV